MTKVTYLFGAGASAKALPVVENLPKRIIELAEHWIKGENRNKNLLLPENEYFEDFPNRSKREFQNQMLADMEWLSQEADPSKHASVDTLAKKLFLKKEKGSEDLRRLKIALSIFFILEQARIPVDVRYDAFFASILNETPFKFPENIRIISWNYDYQFEKAYSGFSDQYDLVESQIAIRVMTKFDEGHLPKDHFVIVKLNGTTGFFDGNKHYYYLRDLSASFDLKTMNNVVSAYADLRSDPEKKLFPLLSFAWEKHEPSENSIADKAIACSGDTEILVVIGYSFPFFNREVDRKIIGAMPNLRKVYFQDLEPEKIKTRFQAVLGKDPEGKIPYPELVAYPEVKDFLLPDEL
jgi:hypothetical protein